MTPTRKTPDHRDHASHGEDDRGSELGAGPGGRHGSDPGGRQGSAVALLESAIEPLVEDLGYELLLIEWLGSGKRRVMRLYLDSPVGVTVEDCTRVGRVLGNALDAIDPRDSTGDSTGELKPEPDADAGPREVRDPALIALLAKPYTLEISSPGVDRPLTRRRHFADHIGGRVKLETWAPIEPGHTQKKFNGRIVAVEEDPEDPSNQRRGIIAIHDTDGDRTLRIPLPRIRRANLVWEG